MKILDDLYREFENNSFIKTNLLDTDTFDAIFSNEYEIYFIKCIDEVRNPEEIWDLENEIFDYQNIIIQNSNNLAYNLNFVIISNKVDSKTRRVLEQDKYTSKKVVIQVDSYVEDVELLPFKGRFFNQSNINMDLEELVVEKLKNIRGKSDIIRLLNKDEILEEDIEGLLALLD